MSEFAIESPADDVPGRLAPGKGQSAEAWQSSEAAAREQRAREAWEAEERRAEERRRRGIPPGRV